MLRLAEVKARTGLSRTTIYRRINTNTFPKPVRISAGLVAWYESEIDRWVGAPMDWSELSSNEAGV
nr:AlpA family transcriptional regulator [Novosphingobium silvae]